MPVEESGQGEPESSHVVFYHLSESQRCLQLNPAWGHFPFLLTLHSLNPFLDVYDHHACAQMFLLDAMNAACLDILTEVVSDGSGMQKVS